MPRQHPHELESTRLVQIGTGAGCSDRGHCKSLPDIAPAPSSVVAKSRIKLVALKQNIIDVCLDARPFILPINHLPPPAAISSHHTHDENSAIPAGARHFSLDKRTESARRCSSVMGRQMLLPPGRSQLQPRNISRPMVPACRDTRSVYRWMQVHLGAL